MAIFESSTVVACGRAEVFDLLTVPSRTQLLLPDEGGVRFLSVPERLAVGTRIEFELRGFGLVQRAVHEVIEFESPRRFVEQQVEGPLPVWRHEHLLEEAGDGTTLIRDRVEFEPPAGLARLVVTEARLRQWFEQGFEHRRQRLKELLENPPRQ